MGGQKIACFSNHWLEKYRFICHRLKIENYAVLLTREGNKDIFFDRNIVARYKSPA